MFQQFYLIPNYTALENVMFPMQINEIENVKEKATLILSNIGLDHQKTIYPLSCQVGSNKELQLQGQFHLIQRLFWQMNPQVI